MWVSGMSAALWRFLYTWAIAPRMSSNCQNGLLSLLRAPSSGANALSLASAG